MYQIHSCVGSLISYNSTQDRHERQTRVDQFICLCSCSVPFFSHPLYSAPADYTAIRSEPVTFSSAPDQMCITINISDDGWVEETESFVVTLVTEDPAVHIVLPFASVTITDSTGTYLVLLGEGSFIHTLSFHSRLAITVVLWQLNDPKIACIASAMKNKIMPA